MRMEFERIGPLKQKGVPLLTFFGELVLLLCLFVVIVSSTCGLGCDGHAPCAREDDTGGECETDVQPDARIHDVSDPFDSTDLMDGEGAYPTDLTCAVHSDCPCAGGVCVSTDQCWCPPCATDDDCWDDLNCIFGRCVRDDSCNGPPRITPTHGPSTGGTILTFEGVGPFYIGAMAWVGVVGSGESCEMAFAFGWESECQLSMVMPPMSPGTYPVDVFYGWPGDGPCPESSEHELYFTYEPSDEPIGGETCRSDYQCQQSGDVCSMGWCYGSFSVCDLGLGKCVPNICMDRWCPEGEVCDRVQGCIAAELSCSDDSDCHLISSDCSCQAVHVNDPRDTITSCTLDACETCEQNWCDVEHIEVVCERGVCTERRGGFDPRPCTSLELVSEGNFLNAGGRLHALDAAEKDDVVALVWTHTVQETYRYGTIGSALVDIHGVQLSDVVLLDYPAKHDSMPAVAGQGDGFGVAWVAEHPPFVAFQRIDSSGAPIGQPREIAQNVDLSTTPFLFEKQDGFTMFWAEQDWTEHDGLYRSDLSPDGQQTEAAVDYLDWVVPQSGDMRVVEVSDRNEFLIAWDSEIHSLEGLYLTRFPLGDGPVYRLAEDGHGVDVQATSHGSSVVWRESTSASGNWTYTISFQSFDHTGRPLMAPRVIVRGSNIIDRVRLQSLGGVHLLMWTSREAANDDTRRLYAQQLTELGDVIGEWIEVAVAHDYRMDFINIDVDSAILSTWIDPQLDTDVIRFARWECTQ